jgi:hypothetical protein
MTGRLVRAALALGLAQLIGCAQGYDSSLDQDPPTAGGFAGMTSNGGRGGATSQAGRGASGTGSGAAGTMYTGEPCERGETEECMCEGDQGMGIRSCRKDDLSPTMGSFSECESCVPDEEPAGGAGGNGSSGSGSAGRGGAGGSAGRAGSSSGSAGSSSGSAGRSGSGNNDPGWCLFVPVPLPGVCD